MKISLKLVELLDPGEDVHGDAAGHDLEGHDGGQDGHPCDLVRLEPVVQLRSAAVLEGWKKQIIRLNVLKQI